MYMLYVIELDDILGEFFPLERHGQHDLGWVLGAVAVSAHGHTGDEARTLITKV